MPTSTSPWARDVDTAGDDQPSAAPGPEVRQRDAAFVWPPSEADLDAIVVWDTRERCEVRFDSSVAPAVAPAALRQLPLESPALVTDTRESDGLATRTPARAPLEVVVQAARRPPTPAPIWSIRSLTAAAIAMCGLASVTWLELRNLPTRSAPADTVQLETSSAPLVSRYAGGTMPLIVVERVRPHALTHVVGRQRLTTSADPQPDPPRIEKAAPVPLSRLTIAGNADARGHQITDISRMALPTRAIESSPVPPTPPAHAASAGLAGRDVAETSRAVSSEARDEERNIYQVVQQYERAYEQLDVNAARAIWPSVDARALARAFDGLKEQKLEFSSCHVAVATGEATVVCGGRASYVTRVGHHATRIEPREWTFRLRKIDANWLITKTEVQ